MSRLIVTQQIHMLSNEITELQTRLRDVIEPALAKDDSKMNRREKTDTVSRLNKIRKQLSQLQAETAEALKNAPAAKSSNAAPELHDLSLECQDCHKDFNFSVEDQKYHQTNGYENPKRCGDCRAAKKAARPRDLRIDCSDCDKYFWFTVTQQRAFAQNQWENPKRCSDCSAAKKARSMKPKSINCKDCHNDFTFSVGAQKHFTESGWKPPVRCSDCRKSHRSAPAPAPSPSPAPSPPNEEANNA